MPAAGKAAHVRRLLVDRSRCGLEVSPAPPGDPISPGVGRRVVVAQAAASPSAGGCGVEDQVGRAGATSFGREGSSYVDIILTARHTELQERFLKYATTKLSRIEKLDSRAIRVDVEVSTERNPRQSD